MHFLTLLAQAIKVCILGHLFALLHPYGNDFVSLIAFNQQMKPSFEKSWIEGRVSQMCGFIAYASITLWYNELAKDESLG